MGWAMRATTVLPSPTPARAISIATASGTLYNDTGLAANTSYSYRTRATDAAGNLSPYSNVASVPFR